MKKYAAFAVISYILSMLMQIIATLILNALGFENIDPAQGPYFIIFALLHLYYGKLSMAQTVDDVMTLVNRSSYPKAIEKSPLWLRLFR